LWVDGTGKDEMRGFFAALRMTIVLGGAGCERQSFGWRRL